MPVFLFLATWFDSRRCLLALLLASHAAMGQAGGCLRFNGQDSYVDCGRGTRGIQTRLTIEVWLKTTSLAEQVVVAHHADSAGAGSGFVLGLRLF